MCKITRYSMSRTNPLCNRTILLVFHMVDHRQPFPASLSLVCHPEDVPAQFQLRLLYQLDYAVVQCPSTFSKM